MSPSFEIHVAGDLQLHWSDVTKQALEEMEARLMKELDDLQAQVEKNAEVDASAILLIKGLADRIEALKNDPVKIQALADDLRAKNETLAAAVVAGTPAESAPSPTPEPTPEPTPAPTTATVSINRSRGQK